jgi:hypothetical protein
MKKTTILLISALVMILFTQCNNASIDQLVSNSDSRGNIISELMNNDAYRNQIMDSLRAKHAGVMFNMSSDMMKGDKQMRMKMMDNMMEMCKSDTSMFKMMMSKTMNMCEMDEAKCKMMASSMHGHPKVMKSMKMNKMK